MRILFFSIVSICLLTSPVFADIYKCVSEDGTIKFSDEPCSNDAKVAFETEDSMTFDEIIDNGSPYAKLPIKPSLVNTKDISEHAKKIGQCIIPGEYINNIKILESSPPGDNWTIDLYFGPSNVKKYHIEMSYITIPSKKGVYVFLSSFRAFKEHKYFDPPSLLNIEKFKRKKLGRWESNIDHHIPIIQPYN